MNRGGLSFSGLAARAPEGAILGPDSRWSPLAFVVNCSAGLAPAARCTAGYVDRPDCG